jgi:dolichol-phosphate mannosyltransferase
MNRSQRLQGAAGLAEDDAMQQEPEADVTIVAPAYNEEEVIERFVRTVHQELPPSWNLLVVDDGSEDRTYEILSVLSGEFPSLQVVQHESNAGMGAALATGFTQAAGAIVVTMDADLSHPLALAPDLAIACETHTAAFGSRYVSGGGMVGVPTWRVAISRVANGVMRLLFRSRVRDMTTGYRAYRRDAVTHLGLAGRGFETQLEITVRLIASGASIVELPMVLTNREIGESKMRYAKLLPIYGGMVLRLLPLRWARRTTNDAPVESV